MAIYLLVSEKIWNSELVNEMNKMFIDDEIPTAGAVFQRLLTEFNSSVNVMVLDEGITSRSDTRDLEEGAFTHPRTVEYLEILAKKHGAETGLVFAEWYKLIRSN